MIWQFYALIAIVTTSIGTLLERILMRDDSSDPISFTIVFQFTMAFATFILALVFGKFVLPHDFSMWYRYLISTILWAGMMIFSFKSIKLLPAAEATIINTSSSIVSIILGLIFLNEKLSLISLIGILLIFIAIAIVYLENLSFKSKSGVIFGLISAICGGAAVINDTYILKTYEAFSYTTLMSLFPGILLVLIFPKHVINNRSLFKGRTLFTMLLLGTLYSISAIAYYVAIEQHAPISKLAPMCKSSIILIVLLAAIFLHERTHILKKILASIIVTLGAILIG